MSAACIPHPDKVEKGGEDAFGVIREKGFVALADGVGGWGDDGVDPAAYSQALVANCVLAREARSPRSAAPRDGGGLRRRFSRFLPRIYLFSPAPTCLRSREPVAERRPGRD